MIVLTDKGLRTKEQLEYEENFVSSFPNWKLCWKHSTAYDTTTISDCPECGGKLNGTKRRR